MDVNLIKKFTKTLNSDRNRVFFAQCRFESPYMQCMWSMSTVVYCQVVFVITKIEFLWNFRNFWKFMKKVHKIWSQKIDSGKSVMNFENSKNVWKFLKFSKFHKTRMDSEQYIFQKKYILSRIFGFFRVMRGALLIILSLLGFFPSERRIVVVKVLYDIVSWNLTLFNDSLKGTLFKR